MSYTTSLFYQNQFVQNEETEVNLGSSETTVFPRLQHFPAIESSMTGTIYRDKRAIQTFVEEDGSFTFTDIGNLQTKVISGRVDPDTGELELVWNMSPGWCHMVVSYECDCADYEERTKELNSSKKSPFIKPTFEEFFTHEELKEITDDAGTICLWDYNKALGDTVREKYESLYCKINELTQTLIKKGAAGYFWIVVSPEIVSVFETSLNYRPFDTDETNYGNYGPIDGVFPMGIRDGSVIACGSVNKKWRLYKDSLLPTGMLIIGCNDVKEDRDHYAKMIICNFTM